VTTFAVSVKMPMLSDQLLASWQNGVLDGKLWLMICPLIAIYE